MFFILPILKFSLQMSVSEDTIKKGFLACLRGKMGKTYPIKACTGNDHARHFIGSGYILW